VFIDGINIMTLGLHKLRKSMSVINQIPVLFSGRTVRENLDPFYHSNDEDIINALTDVQMIDAINSLPNGINSQVAESGSNFSTGERQLLCLARAILQKRKLLILDEPTANVDSRTDKLLQEAVKKSFSNATIISVAHRLDTVIDYDLILVLGGGEVLEFGSPSELISLNGHFSRMIDDTGTEMSIQLRKRAQGASLKTGSQE
jgi:ATP-binding cassette subfamily C (CFTR/MRP) protein 4